MTSEKATNADKEKARNEMLFLKASLNKLEENRMEKARKSAKARFLNEGEQCSKYWFTLNKPKEPENIILGLQNEEGAVQTETRKMIDNTSSYHKQLQSKPQMNPSRRRGIEKIKKHIKVKLDGIEVSKLKAITSAMEVEEALKQAQT